MDTAKPQLMDRPKAEAKHAASEASGAALVSALDAVLGVQADVALDAVPVPHGRVERWKYTPVAAWWKDVLAPEVDTVAAAGCEQDDSNNPQRCCCYCAHRPRFEHRAGGMTITCP